MLKGQSCDFIDMQLGKMIKDDRKLAGRLVYASIFDYVTGQGRRKAAYHTAEQRSISTSLNIFFFLFDY